MSTKRLFLLLEQREVGSHQFLSGHMLYGVVLRRHRRLKIECAMESRRRNCLEGSNTVT
jgi:hypothetical protein